MSSGQAETFECDGCGATVTCSKPELRTVWGWREHAGTKAGRTWRLLLCDRCEPKPK